MQSVLNNTYAKPPLILFKCLQFSLLQMFGYCEIQISCIHIFHSSSKHMVRQWLTYFDIQRPEGYVVLISALHYLCAYFLTTSMFKMYHLSANMLCQP